MSEIEQLLSQPGWLEGVVKGALKSCITAHGPITKDWTQSATKRIVGQIRGELLSQSAKKHRDETCKWVVCQPQDIGVAKDILESTDGSRGDTSTA